MLSGGFLLKTNACLLTYFLVQWAFCILLFILIIFSEPFNTAGLLDTIISV
ncbi:hypothetical protein PHET_06164 [Paragonimus heterotremus]|uniref:Uncharacterized protein n=1 Tax=Paragonimus heterotremus TaxID=100268 RepID=A0A8J4SNI6_9TREM|nr:hypothetical protein PHET_06164 [Paragonimus heterotremus]